MSRSGVIEEHAGFRDAQPRWTVHLVSKTLETVPSTEDTIGVPGHPATPCFQPALFKTQQPPGQSRPGSSNSESLSGGSPRVHLLPRVWDPIGRHLSFSFIGSLILSSSLPTLQTGRPLNFTKLNSTLRSPRMPLSVMCSAECFSEQ